MGIAAVDLVRAEDLFKRCDYHLRDEELSDAKSAIISGRPTRTRTQSGAAGLQKKDHRQGNCC
jgi:hypothetical protein